MSTLTKVFVFLVFLLSLVYLGVSATLFSYRIDFKAKWEKEKADHTTQAEADKATIAAKEKEIEGHKDDKRSLGDKLAKSETDLAAKVVEIGGLNTKVTEKDSALAVLGGTIDKQGAQIADLEKQKASVEQILNDTRLKMDEIRKDRDAIQSDLFETRDGLVKVEKALAEESKTLEKVARELFDAKLKLGFLQQRGVPTGEVPGVAMKPVSDGQVVVVSGSMDLQILSLGKNDGVEPGMEFTVARGAQYICVVVVEKVEADYSCTHSKSGTKQGDEGPAVGDRVSPLVH